ncbi:hypothetical protein [Anaerotignum sp.]
MSEKFQEIHQYDDIIHLPHHQSVHRPQMPVADRAAQFAPFSALSGYDEMIKDAAEAKRQEK